MSTAPGLAEASSKETTTKEGSIPAYGRLFFDVMGFELGESSGIDGKEEEDRGVERPAYQIYCD